MAGPTARSDAADAVADAADAGCACCSPASAVNWRIVQGLPAKLIEW